MSQTILKEKELIARISDLESEIRKLKNRKKYGLVWEDKPEDVVFQCQENVPILKEVKGRKIFFDNLQSTNILIEGDNFHSLSVLNYTHKGRVDVVYIDPPYNTGARDWRYNNDYVDGEDPYRHSKWVSFLYKRIKLAKNLLKPTGVICVTIDDYELARVLMLLDEIFGDQNHLGTVIIRNNPKGRMTNRKVSLVHEYAIFYGNTDEAKISKLPENPEDKTHSYVKDKDGSWYLPINLRKQGVDSLAVNKKGKLSDRYYPIYFDPKKNKISISKKMTVEILPIDQAGEKRIWRRGKEVIESMFRDGDLWVQEIKGKYQVYFKFRGGLEGRMVQSIWSDTKYSASEYGTLILDDILGKREQFQYPKSPHAVMDCVLAASSLKDAMVVDFFAGSGTTGHAVLELNKQDGGNRKFVLCTNNENNICEEVTYERLKRVIKGYKNKGNEEVSGLGGNLSYYKTDLVSVNKLRRVSDESKIKITYQAGEMIALREDTLNEVEKNEWWQIFEGNGKITAVYFTEDKTKLKKFIKILEDKNQPTTLYVFGWGKNEYKNDYSTKLIRVEDIPEPILEVYKEINRI